MSLFRAGAVNSVTALDPESVTWDTTNSNAVYAFDNSDLDAQKTSDDSTWGDAAVIERLIANTERVSVDLEIISRETGERENFGIIVSTDNGSVTGGGFLSGNVTDRCFGYQPDGSLSASDIVTIDYDGVAGELSLFINNTQFGSTLTGIGTGVTWRLAYNNYRTGGEARIREQIYEPPANYIKLTA